MIMKFPFPKKLEKIWPNLKDFKIDIEFEHTDGRILRHDVFTFDAFEDYLNFIAEYFDEFAEDADGIEYAHNYRKYIEDFPKEFNGTYTSKRNLSP